MKKIHDIKVDFEAIPIDLLDNFIKILKNLGESFGTGCTIVEITDYEIQKSTKDCFVKLPKNVEVIDTCDVCGCNEFLCGHNKKN